MEYLDDQHLETKKQYARYVVEVLCKSRNLPIPSFNFDGCPEEAEEELAHYHPDNNRICISKGQLNQLSFDELRDTMVHEAAHILVGNHDDDFSKEEFINNLFVGELSIEAFIIESGKERMNKMIATVETILVRINNEEIKFRIPLEIVPLSFKPVTKHSNLGIDVEYIVKNDYLGIKVEASGEERGRKDFQE
ncbi:MAG TPA: hypothetical protein VMW40_07605 [Candidatus Bathyarchaeia archaeon]|nr:hypothetical protein [Candidatus Bathyarchaeia archaeon]